MLRLRNAEEDTTPERDEEHANPPKKRNVESLPLAMSEDLMVLELPLPTLQFAATILESCKVINSLMGKYSNFILKKSEKEDDLVFLILTKETKTEMITEVIDWIGCACFFYGGDEGRRHAYTFWVKAMGLRFTEEGNNIPKKTLSQGLVQRCALKNQNEVESLKDLNSLYLQDDPMLWVFQTFLIGKRVLKKNRLFPDTIIVCKMFEMGLQGWEAKKFDYPYAFAFTVFLIELFGTDEFLKQLVLHPKESQNVVELTFVELFKILQKEDWKKNQTQSDTVLTFDHLMVSLEFLFKYQVLVHDHSPAFPAKKKKQMIMKLIVIVLNLLMPIQKSDYQKRRLVGQLRVYGYNYEKKRIPGQQNLLFGACFRFTGKQNQFDLINVLLEAGSDPNVVDRDGNTPLHHLAKQECSSNAKWNSAQAEKFTALVENILGNLLQPFIKSKRNVYGELALQPFKKKRWPYPNSRFCSLLTQFFENASS
ncbi:hypothetical protein DAPPUDRAFT_257055 [Daphnia pulex]|uniref:Ankyrin repeat domain-containing protein 54 n=1 Tax=Daphnia pulex TaxID=6669 RepID=E9HCQ4_DAPPU|nr:hypothetical protein DAPPUDRAFT_257055 [Daphnia pulex]|eukprot:EFX70476.1 hypothetical protein DAPPUDRAFT_257055 [Daphnia pulex]